MKLVQNRKIVLASGSPRRKEYLERYQLSFRIQTGDVDESHHPGEQPVVFAERMAEEKAMAVQSKCEADEIIIAADTIVVLDNQIIGKPDSVEGVLPMLQRLNGQKHEVVTSYVVLDHQNNVKISKTVKTGVKFNKVSDNVLTAYAKSEEPLDKAGAYSVQGIGTILVDAIEGSYNNVVGLPIEVLFKDLIDMEIISI